MANVLTSSAILALATLASHGAQVPQASPCRPSGPLVRIESLSEASGVAASRGTPGVYWAHNDSGDPVIFALDEQGAIKGRVRVTGARVDDWEDLAVGRCASGWCLYIADIGDNSGKRGHITVYRVTEPVPGDEATAQVDVFEATYPDGAADAEALFVTGESVFIVTKGDPGPVALYRLPGLDAGRKVRLERVGEPLATRDVAAKNRPTAADVSQDGRWVAVRTTHYVSFYRTEDLTAGQWREAVRADVTALGERRGEGLAFTAGGDLVLVGEAGGPLGRSGTFARIACDLPR
jgi:hypothetical protein